MMSSAIPSLRYSNSGLALRFANGRTAIDSASPPLGAASSRARTASANWEMVANRSAGTLASAFSTARSNATGTDGRALRIGGGGSIERRAMRAWTVGPANGGLPASISYNTHPRLYRSLRPSIVTSPPACSGLM